MFLLGGEGQRRRMRVREPELRLTLGLRPCGSFQTNKLTVPTLLMAQVKQWLAMAAFRASMGHMGSLGEERTPETHKKNDDMQGGKRPKSP